jgi:hypothetical protein
MNKQNKASASANEHYSKQRCEAIKSRICLLNGQTVSSNNKNFDHIQYAFLTEGQNVTEQQRMFFKKFHNFDKKSEILEAFKEYNAHANLEYILPRFVKCSTGTPLSFLNISKGVDIIIKNSKVSEIDKNFAIIDKSWNFYPSKTGLIFRNIANSLATENSKSIWRRMWECLKEELQP